MREKRDIELGVRDVGRREGEREEGGRERGEKGERKKGVGIRLKREGERDIEILEGRSLLRAALERREKKCSKEYTFCTNKLPMVENCLSANIIDKIAFLDKF